MHAYIHNWPLQPFSLDYGLTSNATHVVCVNVIHDSWGLQFNIYSKLRTFFLPFCFTFKHFVRNLLRGRHRTILFFIFHFDVWLRIQIQALRLISQHTTYWTAATFNNQRHVQIIKWVFYSTSISISHNHFQR